jgi:hypothetical protein
MAQEVAAVVADEDARTRPAAATDPWAVVRRQQDRRRYLRILTPRRVGTTKARRPNPADGVPRDSHHLLASPAALTRTAANLPPVEDVRSYLRHSCDLTMRGGPASAVVYPLAVCALAEHYVIRRIAGSSAAAASAAATAAAEVGRGVPDATGLPGPHTVPPGFAGLAGVTAWLCGQGSDDGIEQNRLARLLQPSDDTRAAYRFVAAWLHAASTGTRRAGLGVALAALAALGRASKAVMALVWIGFALGGAGMVASQLRAAEYTPGASFLLALYAALALVVALLMAALLASAAVAILATRQFLATRAEPNGFGLVPGIARTAPGPIPAMAARLDRLAGLPAAAGVPPVSEWLADRIDDLAGIPDAGDARPRAPLTFGDLWLGRCGERSPADEAALRRAAREPEWRVVDLVLVTTDVSLGRPYRFPLDTADQTPRTGAPQFLHCADCLGATLPARVVDHIVATSPSTEPDHTCPRHPGGVLRELPDPWDLPVVAAVRMSLATPGLLSAVPLYSVAESGSDAGTDEWGGRLDGHRPGGHAPLPDGALRTHWLCDGGVTAGADVDAFDALLPRWPTFAFGVDQTAAGDGPQWVRLPAQDASPGVLPWRPLDSSGGFLRSVLAAATGWRDALQAQSPGFRGRVATVRRGPDDRGHAVFLPQRAVLRLAVRGFHAGQALRERFTGPDGDVEGQTQTDRYRWIRMRMALREYRRMSMSIAARVPLYSDLASTYRVPSDVVGWFSSPVRSGTRDPVGVDAAATITTLRAMSTGGVLDYDAAFGAPPGEARLHLSPGD